MGLKKHLFFSCPFFYDTKSHSLNGVVISKNKIIWRITFRNNSSMSENDSLKPITIKEHVDFTETKRSVCMRDYIFTASREHLNCHLSE